MDELLCIRIIKVEVLLYEEHVSLRTLVKKEKPGNFLINPVEKLLNFDIYNTYRRGGRRGNIRILIQGLKIG